MQLLHHITTCILVPKAGWFDFITERELMLMTILAWRMAVNLLGIMVYQMQEPATSRCLCLPYDDWSLHRIGYQKLGGRWIMKGQGRRWSLILRMSSELLRWTFQASIWWWYWGWTIWASTWWWCWANHTSPCSYTHRDFNLINVVDFHITSLRAQIDDDIEKRVNSIVSVIREDIYILSIKVDRMQTEMHMLSTHTWYSRIA